HRREVRDAEEQVVGVETGRVGHVPLPGDVDGDEEPREAEKTGGRVVGDESVRELRDRDDEDEVEEELEPRRVALSALLRREQARRDKPGLTSVPPRRSPLDTDSHPAESMSRAAPLVSVSL